MPRDGKIRKIVPWRLGVACAVLVIAGCGRLHRVSECRTLAQTVNPVLDSIEHVVRVRNAPNYLTASQAYAQLAQRVRAIKLPSASGQALTHEYADILDSVAPVLGQYAATLEQKNPEATSAAARNLEQTVFRERAFAGRMQAYCQGR